MEGLTMKASYSVYENVFLEVGRYMHDSSIAVKAYNRQDGPIATLTVCIPGAQLEENESCIDTNNCPWAVEFFEKNGIAEKTNKAFGSGFCVYPVMKFNVEKLAEFQEV